MASPIDQIENLMANSGLKAPEQLGEIRQHLESFSDSATTEQLLDALVEQGQITNLHRDVFLAECPGPFRFGDYIITEKRDSTDGLPVELGVRYRGRHLGSGHPVILRFFSGELENTGTSWKSIAAWADRRSAVRSDNLVALYQTLVLPQYRLIVSQLPPGRPLAEKIPVKTRLAGQQACKVAGFVAQAIADIHRAGLSHGNIWPGNVWVLPDGSAVLEWDLAANLGVRTQPKDDPREAPDHYHSDNAIDEQADWYGLGCLLYRLLSGRVPNWPGGERIRAEKIASLAKLDLPKPVIQLVQRLTSTGDDSAWVADEIIEQFTAIAGCDDFQLAAKHVPATHAQLIAELNKSSSQLAAGSIDFTRTGQPVEHNWQEIASSFTPSPDPPGTTSLTARRRRRKRVPNWLVGTAAAILFLLIAGLVYTGFYGDDPYDVTADANRSTDPPANAVPNGAGTPDDGESPSSTTDPGSEAREPSDLEGTGEPASSGWLIQQLVESDDLLWESPTDGRPIDFDWVPSAPDFVFTARPAELLDQEEGRRLLQALGPDFQRGLEQWESEIGVELSQIREMVISLHAIGSPTYQPFFMIRLSEPVALDRLQSAWGAAPSPMDLPDDQRADGQLFTSSRWAYWIPSRAVDGEDRQQVVEWVVAPEDMLRSTMRRGPLPLSGTMGRLAQRLDGARHFNVMLIPRRLSNEQSMQLFSGSLAQLRRPLMLFFDDRILAAQLSLHLDEDCYWELRFERSPDLQPTELREVVDQALRNTRDRLTLFAATLPDDPYWIEVKARFNLMLQFIYRYTRMDVEHGEVVVNGWLPGNAPHNVVAASELALAASSGASPGHVSPVEERRGPQTMEELLNTRRRLTVATSPDLINLLADLQQEVRQDFPQLPFEFEIRLMGADLSADGITQNQRPGNFDMPDNTLAEILTEVAFRANPDENAESPRDELCRLIWVAVDDPDQPGRPVILFTTRSAAAANRYPLPEPFRAD